MLCWLFANIDIEPVGCARTSSALFYSLEKSPGGDWEKLGPGWRRYHRSAADRKAPAKWHWAAGDDILVWQPREVIFYRFNDGRTTNTAHHNRRVGPGNGGLRFAWRSTSARPGDLREFPISDGSIDVKDAKTDGSFPATRPEGVLALAVA